MAPELVEGLNTAYWFAAPLSGTLTDFVSPSEVRFLDLENVGGHSLMRQVARIINSSKGKNLEELSF